MVRLLLIGAVLVAHPALGQDPDSVSAHRYLPLDVGAHWQYELFLDECLNGHGCHTHFVGYLDRLVTGDSTAGGTDYQVVRDMRFDPAGEHQHTHVHLIRFDTLEARALERLADGNHQPWPDIFDFGCRLDLPEGGHTCDSDELWTETFVTTGFPSWVPGGTAQKSFKAFEGLICFLTLVADVGMTSSSCVHGGGPWDKLRYANVGGVEYGVYHPLTIEEPISGAESRLTVFPNPAMEWVTVSIALTVAQDAALEVFDLLGRRVLERELGTLTGGEHEVMLGLGSLPAGQYLVRLTGDVGATAVVRLTRVRSR